MILYFADRHMNILGHASTELPEGLYITDDQKTEEVEAGVATLEFTLNYTDDTRKDATQYAYQNFCEMYEAYHALGGNGMVTKMKQEIDELHLKKKGD